MSRLSQLQEKRNQLSKEIKQHAADNFINKRWKDSESEKRWDDLNDQFDSVVGEMDGERGSADVAQRLQELDGLQNKPNPPIHVNGVLPGREDTVSSLTGRRNSERRLSFQDSDGNARQAVLHGESLSKGNAASDEEVGQVLQSMVTGDWTRTPQNHITGDVASDGGILLGDAIHGRMIDLARDQSVAMRAGAQTIPMRYREEKYYGITQDPTAHWRPEGGHIPGSSISVNEMSLHAKTIACIVPFTVEIAEDASGLGRMLVQVASRAIAQEMDRAILLGQSTKGYEPYGIMNTTGVNEIASVGTPTNHDNIVKAVQAIQDAKFSGSVSDLGWIAAPRDWTTYETLKDTTGQPLREPSTVQQLSKYFSTKLPTDGGGGSNESSMIVGDFSQVIVGIRGGLRARIVRDGMLDNHINDTSKKVKNSSLNLTEQLMGAIVVHMRMDSIVLRPDWLTKLTGVTAS